VGVLRNFESRLERGIEGFFTKAFRSGLQPVEIAKRILRAMEAEKTVSVREVWVPNRYVLSVSAEDRQRFENMENALRRELENVVTEGARERGYGLVARPEVVFETDEGMKRGDLLVAPEFSEETGPPSVEVPAQQPVGSAPASPSAEGGPSARLVQVDGAAGGGEWTLDRDQQVIGRLQGSDIEVQDTGASRRHAEIRRQGGDFVIVDLGSTNGTLVNDSPVSEHTLENGDRITIGRTVLEFRRG
jgi:Protein of unknown function (DUF3662)/FHA domain